MFGQGQVLETHVTIRVQCHQVALFCHRRVHPPPCPRNWCGNYKTPHFTPPTPTPSLIVLRLPVSHPQQSRAHAWVDRWAFHLLRALFTFDGGLSQPLGFHIRLCHHFQRGQGGLMLSSQWLGLQYAYIDNIQCMWSRDRSVYTSMNPEVCR